MNIKEQFIDVLKKLKDYTGWSYREISELAGISQSRLKMAATGQSFSANRRDIETLQSLYNSELSKKASIKNSATDISQDVKEIKMMVQKQNDIILSQYKNIINPTIKYIAEKHNISQEKILEALESVLLEKLNQMNKNEQKKSN